MSLFGENNNDSGLKYFLKKMGNKEIKIELTNLTGCNGAINRTLKFKLEKKDFIFYYDVLLKENEDYKYDNGLILFFVPIWNDKNYKMEILRCDKCANL